MFPGMLIKTSDFEAQISPRLSLHGLQIAEQELQESRFANAIRTWTKKKKYEYLEKLRNCILRSKENNIFDFSNFATFGIYNFLSFLSVTISENVI